MSTRNTIPSLIIAISLFTGCILQEEDAQELQSRAQIEFKALSAMTAATPTSPLSFNDDSGLEFTLDEARINIRRIRLDSHDDDTCASTLAIASDPSAANCAENDELTLTGPFVMNLLTGHSTPVPDLLSIPAGNYRRLKIRVEDARAEDGVIASHDDLEGHSLLVKGTYGTDAKPFRLALNFMEDIEVESTDIMELNSGAVMSILVALDVSKWMTGLDIGACLKDSKVAAESAEKLSLTEDSELGKCVDAEHILKENIKNSLRLEKN